MDAFYEVFGLRKIKNQYEGVFMWLLASGQLKTDMMDAFYAVFGLGTIPNQ